MLTYVAYEEVSHLRAVSLHCVASSFNCDITMSTYSGHDLFHKKIFVLFVFLYITIDGNRSFKRVI